MYASCAKAIPPHTSTAPTATRTISWRAPNEFVRTVPAAVKALLYLMLRRFPGRSAKAPTISNGLRFLPQLELARVVDIAERDPLPAELGLEVGEPGSKTLTRDSQRILRIELQRPGQGNDREEQVPKLIERPLVIGLGGELAGFLGDRLRGGGRRCEVEADARRALLQTERPRERRQSRGDPVDHRLVAALRPRLPHLLVLPVAQHLIGARDGHIAEDVRVPLDHLRGHSLGHLRRVEAFRLGGDLRVHRDLEQHIAELLTHLGVVARVDRFEQLVRLLEEVWAQRLVRLLAVPWAAARRTQAVHHLEDRGDAVGKRLCPVGHGREITAAVGAASYSAAISSSTASRSCCQPSPLQRIRMRLGRTAILPAIRRTSSSTSSTRPASTRMTMS